MSCKFCRSPRCWQRPPYLWGGGFTTAEAQLALPDIADKSVNADSTFRHNVTAQNAAGPVTYSIDPPVEGARIHPATGHLVYLPPAGHANTIRTITVHADDGGKNIPATSINVTVGEQIGSVTITETSIGQIIALTGGTAVRARSNYYHDGNTTSFGLTMAAGAGKTNTFFGHNFVDNPPVGGALYYYEINNAFPDPLWHNDTSIYERFTPLKNDTVTIPNPNTRPDPYAPSFEHTAGANRSTVITPDLVGMDGGTLAITNVTNGTWGTATPDGNTIVYTPREGFAGPDTITYTVTDDRGVTGSAAMINITVPSDGIHLPFVVDPSVRVFSTLRLDMTPHNASGQVRYEIDHLEGAFIHPLSGHLRYVPAEGQQGMQSITVRATDDIRTVNATIPVTVGAPIANITSMVRNPDGSYVATIDGGSGASFGFFLPYKFGVSSTGFSPPFVIPPNPADHPLASNQIGSPHPLDDTIYYFQLVGATLPPTAGNAFIYAQLTLGQDGFEIIPNPTTRPAHYVPDINATVQAGQSRTVMPEILLDNDGNPTRITGATGASMGEVEFNGTSVTYTAGADAAGTDRITYTVTDNVGRGIRGIITMTIEPRPPEPVTLGEILQQNTNEGDTINYLIPHSNPDVVETAWSITSGRTGDADIDSDGRFTWTPGEDDGGETRVFGIRVVFDGSMSDGTLAVMVAETNQDPEFDPVNTTREAVAGEPFTLDLNATDQDRPAQALTYSIEGQSDSTNEAAIDPDNGTITWTPDESGTKTIRAAVHDNFTTAPGSDTLDITIDVTAGTPPPANMTPPAPQPTPQPAPEPTPKPEPEPTPPSTPPPSDTQPAVPVDDRTVTAPVSNATIAGILEAYMSQNLVAFSGHPAPWLDAGRSSTSAGFLIAGILVNGAYAGMPGDLTVSDDITVFVNEAGNVPPVLSPVGNYTINAQDTLAFAVSATDFNDTVSYRLAGAPAGAEISEQGEFSWMPGSSDVGGHTFVIAAYDRQNATDTESVAVTVLAAGTPNRSPNAPDVAASVSPAGRLLIIPAISDPDDDPVRITGAAGDAGGLVTFRSDQIEYIAGQNPGIETVIYSIADGRGGVDTGTITITIR